MSSRALRHAVAVLGLAVAVSAIPVRASIPAVPDAVNALRTLSLSERGSAVRQRTLRVGHLELHMLDGRLFAVTDGLGERRGWYYEGTGRYVYRTEDPIDAQVYARNAAAVTNSRLVSYDSVNDTLQRFYLLRGGASIEDGWGPDGPPEEAAVARDDRAVEGFADMIRRAADSSTFRLLEAEVDGGRYVTGEVEGQLETVRYRLDAVNRFEEALSLLKRYPQHKKLWYGRTISEQDIDGGDAAHPPLLYLRHADFTIDTEDNRSGSIVSDLRLEAGRGGVRVASFALLNHRDPDAWGWASDKHALHVRRVVDGRGRELPFVHEDWNLVVDLIDPVPAGAEVTLHVETDGDVFTGMAWNRDDSYVSLSSAEWYPRPLGWDAARFTFTIKARTRKPYTPIASGTLVRLVEDGEYFRIESRCDTPAEFPVLFAGKYRTSTKTFDGLKIRVHSYAMVRKGQPETMAQLVAAVAKFYETFLGPMPFQELDVVEVPEFGFGIATAGVVLITTEAYKPFTGDISNYFVRGVNARVAHEVAHMWFGQRVRGATERENWLTESFSEYVSGLAIDRLTRANEKGARNKRVFDFKQMLDVWRGQAEAGSDAGPILAANELSGDLAGEGRYQLLYNRGPLVLHMLQTMTGPQAFSASLKRYLDRSADGFATTEDFKTAVRETTGHDFGWLIDDWVGHGGVPDIKTHVDVEESGRGWVLSGTVDQPPGDGFKRVLIPIVFELPDGRRDFRLVMQDRPHTTFRFELPGRPRGVQFDPGRNNLADYH